MRIAIIGRNEILYDTAELLLESGHEIVACITAKAAPEYTSDAEDFKQMAERVGASFGAGPRILEFKDMLKASKPEIGVSMNYVGVIPESIIDIFQYGVLNAHGGDLPRYRGNACQAWAIVNGESKIGLCIHKMIGGELDSGPIIARKYYDIDISTRVGEVMVKFQEDIPPLFEEALAQLNNNEKYVLEHQSKDAAVALRCYPRNPDDGEIDWTKSNYEIVRLINASSEPYPGAFSYFKGETIIIWRASIIEDDEVWCGTSGQVSSVNKTTGFIEVLCGSGKIRVEEVEWKGSRVKPEEIIKSIRSRFKNRP